MVFSSNSEEELMHLNAKLKKSLEPVGFSTQEWVTNSITAGRCVGATDDETKVLGYCYSPKIDVMQFKNKYLDNSANTKRLILAQQASVFDPLGLLNPLMLQVKLFMRKLHKSEIAWDEPLGSDLASEWRNICNHFNSDSNTSPFSFPRKTFNSGNLDLVVFCDASS